MSSESDQSSSGTAREESAAKLVEEVIDFFAVRTTGRASAMFRVGLGLVAVDMSLRALLNLERYYSEQGLVPWSHAAQFPEQVVSVVAWAPTTPGYLSFLVGLMLISSLGLVLGVVPRVCAFLLYLIGLGLLHRNPYVVNRGDQLMLIMLFLATFQPLGRVWSLQSFWLRARKVTASGPRELPGAWAQRLAALQVCYVYLYAFSVKLPKEDWHTGKAIADSLSGPALAEWPGMSLGAPVFAALAWGTLLFEALFPVMVWNRRFRPYCLIAGVGFHLGIFVLMRVPMFSAVMMVSYANFLSDADIDSLLERVRSWLPGKRPGAGAVTATASS